MSLTPPATASIAPHWHWLPWPDSSRPGGSHAERLARDWLAPQLDCAADAIPLQRDPHGRPRLGSPFGDRDVGWSHSGEGLLVACGSGLVLGIDLERERPRPRAMELAQRFFRPDEARWLATHADQAARERAFLRLWCAKEAVLKAHGRGLAFGLHRLGFADARDGLQLVDCDPALGVACDWRLREFVPQPGYRAALAWRPAVVDDPGDQA